MSNILGSEAYGPGVEDKLVNADRPINLESIIVCNTGNSDTIYSIRICKIPTASIRDYIYYDKVIEANDTHILNIFATLDIGQHCWVKSTSGLVTFKAFGNG